MRCIHSKASSIFSSTSSKSVMTVFNICFRVCPVTICCLYKRLLGNSNLEEYYCNIGLPAWRKYVLIE